MTIKKCQFVLNKKGLHNLQHIKMEGGMHKAKKKKKEGDEESVILDSKCLNNSTHMLKVGKKKVTLDFNLNVPVDRGFDLNKEGGEAFEVKEFQQVLEEIVSLL